MNTASHRNVTFCRKLDHLREKCVDYWAYLAGITNQIQQHLLKSRSITYKRGMSLRSYLIVSNEPANTVGTLSSTE
jgi:hypothetical protein